MFLWNLSFRNNCSNCVLQILLLHAHAASMSYLAEREREGQNGHIPLFGKICSILPLYEKYFAIYHSFETRVSQTQVWQVTQVSKFYKKMAPRTRVS